MQQTQTEKQAIKQALGVIKEINKDSTLKLNIIRNVVVSLNDGHNVICVVDKENSFVCSSFIKAILNNTRNRVYYPYGELHIVVYVPFMPSAKATNVTTETKEKTEVRK